MSLPPRAGAVRRRAPRIGGLVVLCLLGLSACSPTPPAGPPSPPPSPPLEADELQALARETLEAVARLRGLPLDDLPQVRILPPGAFSVESDMRSGASAAGPRGDDLLVGLRVLAGLGMVAPGGLTTRAMTDGAIGNYDCVEDVVRVTDLRYLPPPPELAGPSGGAPPGWRDLMVSLHALLAHEALHAVVRRNFDLPCPPDRFWPDRDAGLAARAVEEGDAQAVLSAVVLARATPEAPDLELWTANLAAPHSTEPSTGSSFIADFPYAAGDGLLRAVERSGGNAARDEVYRRPPRSTEQVLHPEKYFAGEEPVVVALPDLPELVSRGYSRSDGGTLGEAGVIALLSSETVDPDVLGAEVVPVPGELCEPPPSDCTGLTALPGSPALPAGLTTTLELDLPPMAGRGTEERPEAAAGESAPAPFLPTENWALRDAEGNLRAAAWTRIREAADGWRGDAAEFWLRADQNLPSVVWVTSWDDRCDAEQFRREIVVARPPWSACRRGRDVFVIGGLPRELGEGALRTLVDGTTVTEPPESVPFPFPYVPVPGRLEERTVDELPDAAGEGWPAREEAGCSPLGPTVFRRFVDEDAGAVVPLPAGPYWQVLPAPMPSPLARGVALDRVGGGQLVVAAVAAAALPQVREALGAVYGFLSRGTDCAAGPAWRSERRLAWEEGERLERALVVERGAWGVVVAGWIDAAAAEASLREFDAALAAACDGT